MSTANCPASDEQLMDFSTHDNISVVFNDVDRDYKQAKLFIQRAYLEKSEWFIPKLAAISPVNKVIRIEQSLRSTVLRHYFHFLITGRIVKDDALNLSHVYLFGDIIQDVIFTKAVGYTMMDLFKTEGTCKRNAAVTEIYYSRKEGHIARRMLTGCFCYHGQASWFTGTELVKDIAVEAMRAREIDSTKEFRVEDYLEPEEAEQEGHSTAGRKRKASMFEDETSSEEGCLEDDSD